MPLLARLESRHGPGFLAAELDRDDYLDCLFLLGEHHLEKREYLEAFKRMRTFYLHERNARYPRHYLEAVITHLKDLYLRKLPQTLPPEEALLKLKEAAELRLGRRDQAHLERKVEELKRRQTTAARARSAERA